MRHNAARRGLPAPNAGQKFPAEILSRAEFNALLAACSRRGSAGQRNAAMFAVMCRSGLRIAETLALLPKDVDLAAGTITILRGKGSKRRVVGLDAAAGALVERWQDRRRRLGVGPGRPLFCQIQRPHVGEPLAPTAARAALQRAAARAGLEKRVHPHGLRHTNAYELAMENVPLPVIRAHLGHSKIATTAHYIDHLAPAAAIQAIAGREWAYG